MTSPFTIEPLAPSHDHTDFTCGVDALDRYLRQQASQDVRRRATACFVAREIATDRIAGFYTLAAGGILLAAMSVRLILRPGISSPSRRNAPGLRSAISRASFAPKEMARIA